MNGIRERKQERQKRRRQQLIFVVAGSIVIIAILILAFVLLGRPKKKEKASPEKKVVEQLDQYYASYLNERGGTVTAAVEEKTTFSEWFLKQYEKNKTKNVVEEAEKGTLTDEVFYENVGESMHVASDRYQGYLNDEKTAQEHGIYERKGREEQQAEITVAGDLCLEEDGFVLDHYDTVNDLKQCISPEILEITNQTDIFYLNHEYTISDRGTPLNGKYYTFRAKPERMELLKGMGTDLVSLANNHVYDYGPEALFDTTKYLQEASIPYVGGGNNIQEAKRPVYFIVNGIKIGFVAASNAEKIRYTPQAETDAPGVLLAYDTTEYREVIAEAAKECDYLIAYIHWGTEDTNDFNSSQQEMGREFLNAGADIVVGGHPHVLQGMEYVDGKPIVYSLGDFWFNDETKYTGLLQLKIGIDGLKEMSFVPCQQTNYTTQYLKTREEQEKLFTFLENLSPNVEIDEKGIITERK